MSAHAVSGKLYTGSITGAADGSGTLIAEIEARRIDFRVERRMIRKRTGLKPDEVGSFFGGVSRSVFIFRGRNNNAATRDVLFQELASSGGVQGEGENSALNVATTITLLVRPNKTSENYLYIPNAAIAPENVVQLMYSTSGVQLSENELALVADRAAGGTEPAYAWDSSSNVNALYAGLS